MLSPDALAGLIEEYVSREGTDYGHRDISLADKKAQVITQLDSGEVVISYDAETDTTDLRQKNA